MDVRVQLAHHAVSSGGMDECTVTSIVLSGCFMNFIVPGGLDTILDT